MGAASVWPWDHLAFGYLLYSVSVRIVRRRPPDGQEVVAVALGTQFPDLVDKPLSWTFGVLPSGVSLAHSALVATPVVALVTIVGRRFGRAAAALAFGVGYLSHLVGDAFSPLLAGNPPDGRFLLWPLVEVGSPPTAGLLRNFLRYFDQYLELLATGEGVVYLLAELTLLGSAFALWLYDGWPGLAAVGSSRRRANADGSPDRRRE